MFGHENLQAYQSALRFLGLAGSISRRVPRGHGYFKDQLARAALSIVTNTAEGAGEFLPAEKARFYRMALRSATECAALIDACRTLGLGDAAKLMDARADLSKIVALLTGLARRHQKHAASNRE